MKVGDTWLMQTRENRHIARVRIVNIYERAVEVEERSTLIGWQRPYIVPREDVLFIEKVKPCLT